MHEREQEREWGGKRWGRIRLPAEHGAPCGPRSQDPKIMTGAEGSHLTDSHPGAPGVCLLNTNKELAAWFGVNTSAGLVPLALVPQFLVYFPFPIVRVPANLMVENQRSYNICSWSHCSLLKSFHYQNGLSRWVPFNTLQHFNTSYESGYHLAREFIHFQWVTYCALT